jgi:hypothetical protein
MIYCVWYPAGGFGHFVNAVLTLYGKDFVRPKKELTFSKNGDSHDLDLVSPKYYHDQPYQAEFDPALTYSVLIDNGTDDTSTKFKTLFPNARVIKICYTDHTWPVVAYTLIEKALKSNVVTELQVDQHNWPTVDNWAQREKYFLFLRDHSFRSLWRTGADCSVIQILTLLNYNQLRQKLLEIGIETEDFQLTWEQWIQYNHKYIAPIQVAASVIEAVKTNCHITISQYQDIWTQSVVNYYIWLEYQFEVPANDYANWFTNTNEIAIMLNTHGVLN